MIELLLDRGADVHALHGAGAGDDEGYAPVDFQAIDLALFWQGRGDVETARLLLRRGAAYDLTIAAALGDLARVTALLDEDPARIREARPCGKRPLPAAVEFGHDAIARLLLERGADPTWREGADAPRGFGAAYGGTRRQRGDGRTAARSRRRSERARQFVRQRDVGGEDAGAARSCCSRAAASWIATT